jgi:carbon monoxide dehydrogenase subunit G
MQVKLEKAIDVPVTADAAWDYIRDIRRLAECMPGARITEQVDDNHFNGLVTVKLGPITASFKGKIEVKGIDTQRHELQLRGTGTDASGASTASMNLTASVRDKDGASCQLLGVSDINVSGKIANFGGRMMTQVSDQMLDQFADNLRARVTGAAGGSDASTPKPVNALALFFKALWGMVTAPFRRN